MPKGFRGGVIVHDHFAPYYAMPGGVRHALCNAHPLRELKALIDIDKEQWAWQMRDLLVEANGAVQGAEAVRAIVTYIRTLYEHQEFNFAGPYGENGFLEDYNARVRGEPIGNVVLVTRNAAGQAQHIAANYRPRDALLLLSRLIGEHFAGTPYGEHFAADQNVGTTDMRLEVVQSTKSEQSPGAERRKDSENRTGQV